MEKLTKDDILWITAVLDGRVTEHYQENYVTNRVPTNYDLFFITNDILHKTGQMGTAIKYTQQNWTLEIISSGKKEYTLYEMLFIAFKTWCFYVESSTIDQICDGDWRLWMKEYREKYKKDDE